MKAWLALTALSLVATALPAPAADVVVDFSGYKPDTGVEVRRDAEKLSARWPIAEGQRGQLVLDLSQTRPLIESLGFQNGSGAQPAPLLRGVEPAYCLVVGTRESPADRPPEMSVFNVFFDSPAQRPSKSYLAKLDVRRAFVTSKGRRATVSLGDLTAGPFRGRLELTVYAGAPLVHVEAAMSTQEPTCAYLYDTGLVGAGGAGWQRFGWVDAEGKAQAEDVSPQATDRPIAVRYRALAAGCSSGSVACFPSPHQYFFPRDNTDNLKTVWLGRGHRSLTEAFGFGIRQSETGGGSFVPWFNAPPGTEQRMGVFYLLSPGAAEDALAAARKYTHEDRFPTLAGYHTFTSHWHMAITVAAMQEMAKGRQLGIPDYVKMFKDMGVEMVHLAEFHGDGHPQDPGPVRLAEMDAMFAECKRLSDSELLFMPGEEANVYIGMNQPGKSNGHWLYFFPKPVYWTMKRAPGQPFVEDDPQRGKVYHVGSLEDMVRLLEAEHGLAWTAHPRIKASNWTPDIFRNEPFYKADFWLGGAWKAMPADLARDRLGDRVLDLLSDMDNWGQKKYAVGEVDVFKLDHTHELYGHMNINYVKVDRIPRFEDGWQPMLDALRGGKFFVTTGEVLIKDFSIGGKPSGETLTAGSADKPAVRATLAWTFPLKFAEVVSGDGQRVYRDRLDLPDTGPFGERTITLKPDLAGRTWARLEVWDVATDGAFTQPVWLKSELSKSE
jgi:hypothetical protein